jgi:hypothetical protein
MNEMQVAQVRELLIKKMELFQTIFTCAEQLAGLSYIELETEYNNFLEKRVHCIERIKKTDAVLNHCLSKVENLNQGLSGELATYDDQIKELIRRIMTVDEGNKKRLILEQKTIKEKLQFLREGKKGRRGYLAVGKINTGGVFMDTHR